jgi:hypothetical protein
VPNINNPGVKSHEKYKQFADSIKASGHWDFMHFYLNNTCSSD